MRRNVIAAVLALMGLLCTGSPAYAADPDAGVTPQHLAIRLMNSRLVMAEAAEDADRLRAEPPAAELLDEARRQLLLAQAEFRSRDSIRDEQEIVYRLAASPSLESDVVPLLAVDDVAGLTEVIEGLRSLWRSAGIDDFSKVRMRRNRRFSDSAPLDTLLGYYRDAGGRYQVDWSYLASINFIESDFGRVNGPSSAGALGPMQFMPATWQDYGRGGDIMSPKDSIQAAAYYLNRMGAPASYVRAIYRYNNDRDYVASVEHFAAAMRTDQAWLVRLYYWGTAG